MTIRIPPNPSKKEARIILIDKCFSVILQIILRPLVNSKIPQEKPLQNFVGNKPGVTRQKQWIKIEDNIELMDTPGVLWPKFESEEVALNLAYTGTIKNDILQSIEIGFQLLKFLIKNCRNNVIIRYKLDDKKKTSGR